MPAAARGGVARRRRCAQAEPRCKRLAVRGHHTLRRSARGFESVPRLRLLVHAAATIGPVAPLPVSDPDDWRRAVEVNLLGTYNVLRAALAGPLARDGGLAIHLTSGAASIAKPFWSAYSASKAGAEHLVRSAATDVEGTACGVCSLDPGITETPMQRELRSLDFPDRDRFVRVYEQGSGRTPEEVAAAVCRALAARAERAQRPDVSGRCALMARTRSGPRRTSSCERLFPLCRSLTGSGVRATFDVLEQHVPLERTEIASGTQVFDWTVPDEWNIRDAYIADARRDARRRLPPARACTSSPTASRCATRMSLEALRERLHTLPDQPDAGALPDLLLPPHLGILPVPPPAARPAAGGVRRGHRLDARARSPHLWRGAARGGERGRSAHLDIRVPSVACQRQPLRHRGRDDARQGALAATGCGTPTASCSHRARSDRWRGFTRTATRCIASSTASTVSCIGDAGGLTYKRSRRGDSEIDRAVELVLRDSGAPHRVVDWEPWGGDERQFCSPGFDLPVGCLMRTPHGGFDGISHVCRRP